MKGELFKHNPSTTVVFQSSEYDKFEMIKGNRELDLAKIKRILADIERGTNLLKLCPIIVIVYEGRLRIIDGQHRYVVAKKIKHPVYYIIGGELSLYDIARMNSNTEKWKVHDFIRCYKELGNSNYEKLEDLLKKYPGLTPTNGIALLATGKVVQASYSSVMDKFHRGEFVVENESAANLILEKVSAFNFESKFSRHFIMAIEKVIAAGLYSLTDLTSKVNDNISMLQTCDHWRKFLTQMEEIVSKGKQKRVAIY